MTEPRPTRTPRVPSRRRSPSQIAHHATGTPPIRTRAAHAIASAENAPTQRQRLSGRPPRRSGIRPGGSGRSSGRPSAGPRHGRGIGATISSPDGVD